MVRRISERAQAVIFLVILAVAIAGLYGWAQASQPRAVPPGPVDGVSLLIDTGTWTIRYGPLNTTSNTVFLLLIEASQRLDFAVVWQNYTLPTQVFITSINGTANTAAGPGWQYWVGTFYGDRAANLFPLSNGSNVTWRYVAAQGGG